MKFFAAVIALVVLIGATGLGTNGKKLGTVAAIQKTDTDKLNEASPLDWLENYFRRSEYVHRLMITLLEALSEDEVREPIAFDNFTYDHTGLFVQGESHTYNPVLYGISGLQAKVLVDRDSRNVLLRMDMQEARFEGLYDLWVDWYTIISPDPSIRYRGEDIVTLLTFEKCSLWAESYTVNGNPTTDAEWVRKSDLFKSNYDSEYPDTYDVMFGESVSWYFNSLFGIAQLDMEQTLDALEALASNLDP